MDLNVIYLSKQALFLSLVLSLPIIVIASVVGLLFSIFQALTQVQDQTLSFAIKLVFIIVAIYISSDWIAGKMYSFTLLLYSQMLLS